VELEQVRFLLNGVKMRRMGIGAFDYKI